MKRYLFILVNCFFVVTASAQYNFYKLGVGLNVGVNQTFSDLEKSNLSQTVAPSLDYHLTPFSSLGLEFQLGTLSGGDSIADPHKRFFKNNYKAIIAQGKVQLGQFVDFEGSNFLYAVRGLYVGTGIGVLMNNMKEIVRIKPGQVPEYRFPGKDQSKNVMIPINTGISFNLLDRWGYTRYILNFNYQMNVTFGEGLDGYADPASKFKNEYPDFYSFTSVGLKVCFGPEGVY